MNIFRSRFRSRVISVCLVLVAVLSCLIVPAAAATSDDGVIQALTTGWSSSYAPSGFTSSWFWRVVTELQDIEADVTTLNTSIKAVETAIKNISVEFDLPTSLTSGWSTSLTGTPSGMSGSWYSSIRNLLNAIDVDTGLISSDVSTSRSYLSSIKTSLSNIDIDMNAVSDSYNKLLDIDSKLTSIGLDVSGSRTSISSIQDDISHLDENFSSFYARFIQAAVQIDNIASDTHAIEGHLDVLNGMANNIYLETHDIRGGLDKLVDVFASPNDLALKDTVDGSIGEINSFMTSENPLSSLPEVTGLGSSFIGYFGANFADMQIGPYLSDLFTGYPTAWFSQGVAQCFLVGAGSAASSGVSTYSRYVEPETPFYDANLEKFWEGIGLDG